MTEGAKEQDPGAGGTNYRVAAWVACSLAALSVAIFVASGVLYVLGNSAQFPVDWVLFLADWALFLAFPLVGALIASRRPENPIGWICLASGLSFMLLAVTDNYSTYSVARPGSLPFPVAVGTIGNQWLWVPTVGLLGIYLILLFPDGTLPSRRWRPLAWFSGVIIVVLSITEGLAPGPLENQGGVRNPFGIEALPWLETVSYIILPLLPLCVLASAVSMVLRFRRSRGEERQQIKWFTFVASIAGLMYFIVIICQVIIVLVSDDRLPQTPLWVELLFSLGTLGFAGVPIAIGFAVLKYRLYEIDVVINLTLVYGSLTATLIALYFGGVATTQTILRALTGQTEQSQLAIVVSTLVIAALFNPLRRRIQSFIDRRFYRQKYDARKTLEAFSARLRDETDLETLNNDLAGVIRETIQPAHVSLWLRPDRPPKQGQAER